METEQELNETVLIQNRTNSNTGEEQYSCHRRRKKRIETSSTPSHPKEVEQMNNCKGRNSTTTIGNKGKRMWDYQELTHSSSHKTPPTVEAHSLALFESYIPLSRQHEISKPKEGKEREAAGGKKKAEVENAITPANAPGSEIPSEYALHD
ncbi:unnamed protein product [Trypanosoma congolense IL3000]|uniref:WGS project CAEQ00000000 data, annotated contig 1422 n=1 Tax=Trypanosoma congolense (strain IL3000) TaxID=1068625 RepID=F9W643_TRYCI|nr:unnamed protein product [Trypanosoma congolense IL3000]